MLDHNNGYTLLEEHVGKNALDELFSYVGEWPSDWKNTANAREDVKQGISEIVQHLQLLCTDDCIVKVIPHVVKRQVLQILHDEITSILHKDFEKADEAFFEKCRDLNGKNLTAEAFGPTKNSDIYLTASIVEMANLDSHTDPKSKLDCLVSCFDLIYAELKMVIAEEIADSGKENEIPIVENVDVLPVLMCAIARAKPRHFFSNMEYIGYFCRSMDFNETTRAAAKISAMESADVEVVGGRMRRELNQSDLNEMLMQQKKTFVDRRMKRVTRQIFASLENEG